MVSALIADGPPARLIGAAVDGEIELVVPEVVLTELRRVLKKKLGFGDDRLGEAISFFTELASELPQSPETVESLTGNVSDDRILACAVVTGVDVLVTGDQRHLLPVAEYHGVRILNSQSLLAEIVRG